MHAPTPLVLATLALLFALGGAARARTQVVVSLHPYAALLQQIAGDDADVVQLLPSGASPHTFDPSPSQAASIATADLVVMNGGLDAWLDRLVRSAAPRTPVFRVMDALSFEPIAGDPADADQPAEGRNPHVWLDPVLMAELMPLLAEALGAVDPEHAERYAVNAAASAAALHALDAELRATLAPVAGAAFVPFHDAWPYFARRYGLALVVAIEPFPGREPSARYVAEAVAAIRASGARAVFRERQLSPRPAEVVAQSAGVALGVLDPLGTDAQSYAELLRANAAAVRAALAPASGGEAPQRP